MIVTNNVSDSTGPILTKIGWGMCLAIEIWYLQNYTDWTKAVAIVMNWNLLVTHNNWIICGRWHVYCCFFVYSYFCLLCIIIRWYSTLGFTLLSVSCPVHVLNISPLVLHSPFSSIERHLLAGLFPLFPFLPLFLSLHSSGMKRNLECKKYTRYWSSNPWIVPFKLWSWGKSDS